MAKAAAFLMIAMAPLFSACATPQTRTGAQTCLAAPEIFSQRHRNAVPDYAACANSANLRAMAANPADLEQGRPLGPANGERETLAVRTYEQGLIKPLGQTGTQAQAGSAAGAGK